MPIVALLPVLFLGGLLSGCHFTAAPKGLRTASNFDPRKFEGTWYEVVRSNVPNEKGLTCVSSHFKRVGKNNWQVTQRAWSTAEGRWLGSTKSGVPFAAAAPSTMRLGTFASRNVAIIDDEHTMALICGKKYREFWILSKNPNPEPQRLERMLAAARDAGFPVEESFLVPQR